MNIHLLDIANNGGAPTPAPIFVFAADGFAILGLYPGRWFKPSLSREA